MGCDIHMMIEYEPYPSSDQDKTPYWHAMGGAYIPGRDYKMFALLAGVRGDETLFEQKGLPEQLSHEAKDYYENDSDLHSYTWLTLDEYREALARYVLGLDTAVEATGKDWSHIMNAAAALKQTYRYDVSYDVVRTTMEEFATRGLPTRLIIAFDN